MEGCFMFQWGGGGCFLDGGASFLIGGQSMRGTSVLVGGFEKNPKMGGISPPDTLWETLKWDEKYQNGFAKTNKYLSVLNRKLKVSIIQFSSMKMV